MFQQACRKVPTTNDMLGMHGCLACTSGPGGTGGPLMHRLPKSHLFIRMLKDMVSITDGIQFWFSREGVDIRVRTARLWQKS